MLTKKHLESLARAIGRADFNSHLQAMSVGRDIIGSMRADGVITPNFKADVFMAAVDKAWMDAHLLHSTGPDRWEQSDPEDRHNVHTDH
jgi:hypothetical protein